MNSQANTYQTYEDYSPIYDNVISFENYKRSETRQNKQNKTDIQQFNNNTNQDTLVNTLTAADDDIDDFDRNIKTRHDAEPFKSKEDINKILTYFLDKHMKSWKTSQKHPSRKWNPEYLRNYILFQIGFSCGLRSSDLRRLQIGHFIKPDGTYNTEKEITEQKIETKNNTRRNCTTYIEKTVVDRSGKSITTYKVITPDSSISKNRDVRTIYINQQMIDAIGLYKQYHPDWTRKDYLFPNGYDEDRRPNNEYITRQGMDWMIRRTVEKNNINSRHACHSLRKTFAYHALMKLGNDDRAVKVLQKILNHKSIDSTYHYTGITQDEVKDTCMRLGLGFTQEELRQRGI